MNNAICKFQGTLSKVLSKNDNDKSPTFNELVTTISNDSSLWNEYRVGLRKNHITTNYAAGEYLRTFIKENEERIVEQYFISNTEAKSNPKALSVKRFSSINILCTVISKGLGDEVEDDIKN